MSEKANVAHLEERNRKIIEAIIKKADMVCPGALALIGVYGSFLTGDFCERSDLDLLLLINDDRGWQLGCAFIQDDLQVGHDLYCTTWEQLSEDAGYEHPNISKLMDAEIVYCAEEKYRERLDALRQTVKDVMEAPFSEEDHTKAEKHLKEAEHQYTLAMVSEHVSDVLDRAGHVIYYVENAIAMLNKQYFHYGVKRAYEELNAMRNRPEKLCEMIDNVMSAPSAVTVKERLTMLITETIAVFRQVKETITARKEPISAEPLIGTYEEMYSNWRNKMYAAARTGDRHLAFMSLCGLSAMLSEINSELDVCRRDVLGGWDSQDLYKTAKACDGILNEYLKAYERAGIGVRRYADVDAFALDYQMGEQADAHDQT